MNIHEAWELIGIACWHYKDRKARLALMVVQEDIANKNIKLANNLWAEIKKEA